MKDWVLVVTLMCITAALSTMTTLYIIDSSDKPAKVMVMDFARDLAVLVKNKKINDDNRDAVLADMMRRSESFAEQGYIVLNKSAVLAAPSVNEYRYYEAH